MVDEYGPQWAIWGRTTDDNEVMVYASNHVIDADVDIEYGVYSVPHVITTFHTIDVVIVKAPTYGLALEHLFLKWGPQTPVAMDIENGRQHDM